VLKYSASDSTITAAFFVNFPETDLSLEVIRLNVEPCSESGCKLDREIFSLDLLVDLSRKWRRA
jgi:hypothetical protein